MDVSQYLEIFIDESNEHLQNLSDGIMILEKEPDNSDTINEIFRAAHSLKGIRSVSRRRCVPSASGCWTDCGSALRP